MNADRWAGLLAFVAIAAFITGATLWVMGFIDPMEPPHLETPVPTSTAGR